MVTATWCVSINSEHRFWMVRYVRALECSHPQWACRVAQRSETLWVRIFVMAMFLCPIPVCPECVVNVHAIMKVLHLACQAYSAPCGRLPGDVVSPRSLGSREFPHSQDIAEVLRCHLD